MACTQGFYANASAFEAIALVNFTAEETVLFSKPENSNSTTISDLNISDLSASAASFTTADHVITINSTDVRLRLLGSGIGAGGGIKAAPEYTYTYCGGLLNDPERSPAIVFSKAVFIPLTRRACLTPFLDPTSSASDIEQATISTAACTVTAPLESYRIDVYRRMPEGANAIYDIAEEQIYSEEKVAVQLLVTTQFLCNALVETRVRILQSDEENKFAAWCNLQSQSTSIITPLRVTVGQNITALKGTNLYGSGNDNALAYGSVVDVAARNLILDNDQQHYKIIQPPAPYPRQDSNSQYNYNLGGMVEAKQVTTTGIVYVIRMPLAFAGFASLISRATASSPAPVPVPLPDTPPIADPVSVNWVFIIALACIAFAYLLGGKRK